MDTAWFAIDNDGNVALFETGESGAVPEDAYLADDAYTLQDEIRALPVTGFKLDPKGYSATQWMQHVDVEDANLAPETEIFMFLSDLVPVADLLSRLSATEMDATTSKAIRVVCRDRAALAELHAREACLGCFRDWGDRMDEEIARHGIYRYDHTCENWIAGPYARATVPTKPLTIQEIPAGIRERAIAFDGRFADTLRLQPAEHWKCTSWEHGWLSADGKTARPFEEFADDWEAGAGEQGAEDADGGIKFVNEPLEPTAPPKPRWWK
jgi:hypothetical protein